MKMKKDRFNSFSFKALIILNLIGQLFQSFILILMLIGFINGASGGILSLTLKLSTLTFTFTFNQWIILSLSSLNISFLFIYLILYFNLQQQIIRKLLF